MEIKLPKDFKKLLKLLKDKQVEYLLIGGYAVGYYGYPRATQDIDIWIAIDPKNANRMVTTLKEFGFVLLNYLKKCSYRKITSYEWVCLPCALR